MHWHRAIHQYAQQNAAYVIASVLASTGSAPREAGTKMVITPTDQHDTIGGGQFEYLVVEKARLLLGEHRTQQAIEHFPLAATALQCCGGSITVLFECFAQPPLEVVLFGAGHVGSRVVQLLSELDARLRWIDSRTQLPELHAQYKALADTVPLEHWPDPVQAVADLTPSAHVVILTHDHQLDYALIHALLERAPADPTNPGKPRGMIGMIGSRTKWQRFSKRLLRDGISQQQIDQIHCPIGDPSIKNKQPMAVAVAIVTQLLQQPISPNTVNHGGDERLSWRQIKNTLVQEQP